MTFVACTNQNVVKPIPDTADTAVEPEEEPGGGFPLPLTVNCREGNCAPVMTISGVDLINCFAPDCTLYPTTNCWPPELPEQLRHCDSIWPYDNCEVEGTPYGADFEPLPEGSLDGTQCVCEPHAGGTASLGDPVGAELEEACCYDPLAIHELQFLDITAALAGAECEEPVSYVIEDNCEPIEAATWEVCDPDDVFSVAPNAEFVLTIDEEESYLRVEMPLGTETVAVTGGGSARTGPDKFLTANVAAEDGTLGSQSFTDWLWWMEGPMDIDVDAGTISVPMDVDQVFQGRGKQSSVEYWAEVHMGDDAWGTIDPMTHTWTLDFLQDSLGWEVQLHLEGTYVDAD